MAMTQMVYTKAINDGKMDYSWFHSDEFPDRSKFEKKKDLLKYLEEADKAWIDAVRKRRNDEEFKIKWPGFNANLLTHISTLVSHERLHHGQLISYFTLAEFELPEGFKTNWSL